MKVNGYPVLSIEYSRDAQEDSFYGPKSELLFTTTYASNGKVIRSSEVMNRVKELLSTDHFLRGW